MDVNIHIGRNVNEGGKVFLTVNDTISHIHGIGLSRSGKTFLILYVAQQLIRMRKPFLLLDPHFSLYSDVLRWIVANSSRQEVVLFNPSYDARIVGFNPFLTEYRDEARIMTKAERLSQQLLHVFGLENSDQLGNIERWLRAFFYSIVDLKLSICDLKYFLYWEYEKERKEMVKRVSSELIKADLNELYSSKTEFEKKISSTKNKLQRMIHPQIRRILGLRENNVNLSAVIDKQRIMLCNLQASEDDLVGKENMRALGTLIISELWELFRKRTKPQEFYLIADEAQCFFTPDLIEILPQAAKRGLHCLLFHQDKGQLTPAIASAIKNAQTKIFFSTEENLKAQRQFTLRRANGETIECETPLVTVPRVSPERVQQYVEYQTQYFLTREEVDAKLSVPHNEVKEKELTYEDLIR
jgi:type IV secretory pathway TraG/TraD family ATPase VirD4